MVRFYNRRNFRRNNFRRRRNRNNYFRQHGEQARYAKLVSRTDTVKRIVSVDDVIYAFNGYYSLSEGSSIDTTQIHFEEAKDFQDFAALYSQYRIVGVKVNIYKTCVPEVLVSESTDKQFGVFGFNITLGQPLTSGFDIQNSDTTYWLTFLGGWAVKSKFYSFVARNGTNQATEWLPTTSFNKPIYLNIATKGMLDLPSGWKMFHVSIQFMCEFSNPN